MAKLVIIKKYFQAEVRSVKKEFSQAHSIAIFHL